MNTCRIHKDLGVCELLFAPSHSSRGAGSNSNPSMSFLLGGFSSLLWHGILLQESGKMTKCPWVLPALLSLAATLHSVTHHRQKNVNKEREGIWKEQTHCAQAGMHERDITLYHTVFILGITISPLSRLFFSDFFVIFLLPQDRTFPNRPSNRNSLVIFLEWEPPGCPVILQAISWHEPFLLTKRVYNYVHV